MSGHSKWSQIKRQKAVTDLKKGQVFSKFSKAIAIAAREGGGNPDFNFKLRLLVDRAKASGMGSDGIDRAIKKGSGQDSGANMTAVLYEGLGPDGSAFLVEGVTDNSNRTLQEIRQAFTRHSGHLAEHGSVAWMFEQRGVILAEVADPEAITLAVIDAGAQDVETSAEGLTIYTEPHDLMRVKDIAEQAGAKIHEATISWIAKQPIELDFSKIEKLADALEGLDDVVEVYNNLM